MHNLLEVIGYTELQTSQKCSNGELQGYCSFLLIRIYFIWYKSKAIELASKLLHTTLFGKLSSGILGFLIGTEMPNKYQKFKFVELVQ